MYFFLRIDGKSLLIDGESQILEAAWLLKGTAKLKCILVQAQLSNFSDPDGSGGPNTALNGLNSVTISASCKCTAFFYLTDIS